MTLCNVDGVAEKENPRAKESMEHIEWYRWYKSVLALIVFSLSDEILEKCATVKELNKCCQI